MMKIFRGDIELNTIFDINPADLAARGIKYALCDLDNTLADYNTPTPSDEVKLWIKNMEDAGIQIAIVSNNGKKRVERFCQELDIPYFWKSGKPRKKAVARALEHLGGKYTEAVLIGDKRTTDICCAHLSGIMSVKVKSIKPRSFLWKKK